jgi:succinoglycan biosynthesis transport protein ExoP
VAFGDYVRVLRTFWRSILAVTVLGAVIGAGVTFLLTPKYTATTQVLFTADSGDGSGQDVAYGQTYAQGRMINYQDLARSEQVLGPVVDTLHLGLTPRKLAEEVSSDFPATSTTLNLHVEDTSATEATKIVSAVAQSLIVQVARVELRTAPTDGTATAPTSRVTGLQTTTPVKPTSASSPKLQLYLVGGAMLGLILALAQALVRFVRGNAEPEPARQPQVQQVAPAALVPGAANPLSPPPPPAQTSVLTATGSPASTKRAGRRLRR